jgi:acylphosphatase
MTVKPGRTLRLRVRVTGVVQGVYFRASTAEQARRLGLTGWVRNTPEGQVELEAEGEEASVRALCEWCRRGPPAARVDKLDLEELAPSGADSSFRIRH